MQNTLEKEKLSADEMAENKENIKTENADIDTAENNAAVEDNCAEREAAVGALVAASDNGMSEESSECDAEVRYKSYAKRGFRYGCYLFIKRTFDIVASGIALIILSPIIIIAILAKWLEDRGAPIYTSERVGKNNKDGTRGKNIKFHKIRSMCLNAEAMKQQLINQGLNEADGPAFKMKNDPRITKVGKVLRKFSIDELPQLWDIFVGNLSVVGPRSPIPTEVDEYTPYQMHRLDVKGGLLCLWQIQHNRNALSFDEWVELDIEYIRKQSIWLDLKIIFKGAWMVLFDRSGE